MVPQAFVIRASLPLTVNGKLDRGALSQDVLIRRAEEHVAPRTQTELALAAIWRDLMQLDDVSVRANFFEVGGHSLVAIRVVNEIARRFELELQTRSIFEYSTVESLATYIDTLVWSKASKPAAAIREEEEEVEIEL